MNPVKIITPLTIYGIDKNNQEFNSIDGGFADWTAKLLNNKKERLLTSGIGTGFLLRTIKTKHKNK